MSAFDGNRDGVLNNAERSDAREFAQGDRNHDGALNRGEFGRVDGRLSESDDEQHLSIANTLFSTDPRQFNQYDTNRDGQVDTPEFARGELAEHQRE